MIRIRVLGKVGASAIAHIMHTQYAGGSPTLADVTAFANAFRGYWNTRIGPCVGPNVTYNTFEVADLATLTGAVFSNTTPVTGTHTGTQVPPLSAAIVISWKVNLRFRGGHCRTYLPFANMTDLTLGNTIGTTYQSLVQTSASGLLTDVNAFTSGSLIYAFAMLSYFQHGALRPTPQPYLVTAASVHQRLDTVRRRLGKEF